MSIESQSINDEKISNIIQHKYENVLERDLCGGRRAILLADAARAHELLERGGYAGKVFLIPVD